jgi:hypothetical protein
METKLKESILKSKLDIFSKEFKLKCEKSFLESTNMFTDEDIEYLTNLNPDKDLRYTFNNLTLEQAKKLSSKVFKLILMEKSDADGLNEIIDKSDKVAITYDVAYMQLGIVAIELQFNSATNDIQSEYISYVQEYDSESNKYFWDLPDYTGIFVNPLKLYKNLGDAYGKPRLFNSRDESTQISEKF